MFCSTFPEFGYESDLAFCEDLAHYVGGSGSRLSFLSVSRSTI